MSVSRIYEFTTFSLQCADRFYLIDVDVVVVVVLVSSLLPLIRKIIETNQINTSATAVNNVHLPQNEGKDILNKGKRKKNIIEKK